jgi:AhpD family alkylhydroperoxidase
MLQPASRFEMIKERFSIKAIEPDAYKAMNAMQSYVNESSIHALHRELIKIRASQINGCAYCIQLHTADARKMGESEQRIYALSAWWESPLFTEEEKVILALTEEVTCIAEGGVSDETYHETLRFFTEKQIAELIMQIITINAWNRIAVSMHMVHKH